MVDALEVVLLGSANEVALIRGCSLGLLISASHPVPNRVVVSSNGVAVCYPVSSEAQGDHQLESTAINHKTTPIRVFVEKLSRRG